MSHLCQTERPMLPGAGPTSCSYLQCFCGWHVEDDALQRQERHWVEVEEGSTAEPSLGSGKALSSDPRSLCCNSWILDPDLGSKKFILESWIQINCYGSIVLINVHKRLETYPPPSRKKDSGKAQTIGKLPGKMEKGRSQGGYHILYVYIVYIYISFIYIYIYYIYVYVYKYICIYIYVYICICICICICKCKCICILVNEYKYICK